MSMHKLSAGSGYDYLTRQVAAFDATDKGHVGLASYYTERGESPGVWVGTGLLDVDGLCAGDVVTAEQMRALFGAGMHPVAGYLGQPYRLHVAEDEGFRAAVARAVEDRHIAAGLPRHHPLTPDVRAEVRTAVAVEMFTAQHGREPGGDGLELSDWLASHIRVTSTAVAGFDLTFSPVKSVSTLWAIADPPTSALVERAHQAAVRDALGFIEEHALYSRTGRGGIRQVDVTGLVATAFTHRDSRAGDPDLHTHIAVANKVRTRPTDGSAGSWLSIDGRAVYKAATAASEVYNTSLERHLVDLLGVEFADRDPKGRERGGKRGVREIIGIDPRLNARWSRRRSQIETRQSTLAGAFRQAHGRPPTPVEAIHLAQQATLETRDAKHTARTLTEQRATWHTEAVDVLGDEHALQRMIAGVVGRAPDRLQAEMTTQQIHEIAATVISEVEQRRATWQLCHVQAETQRQLRPLPLTHADADRAFDLVVRAALEVHSVSLAAPSDADLGIVEPHALRRADGTSVYEHAGRTRYSSTRILAAEARLLAHGNATGAPEVPQPYLDLALAEAAAHATPLNPGQTELVTAMATSGRRLQVAIAPAGTGKTTALRALTTAWTEAGGNVIALAPSAAAAAVLGEAVTPGHARGTHAGTPHETSRATSVAADTLAKLTHTLDHPGLRGRDLSAWVTGIGPRTLLLVDEAGMADTLTLERAVTHALRQGATVRLIGDDHQLAAVGAGGIMRDLAHHHGALHLDEVLRFTDPAEATASTRLRLGVRLADALDFYLDHGRVHVADQRTAAQDVHDAWAADRAQGLDSLMIAPTRDTVRDLNHLAQQTVNPQADRPTVPLADGLNGGIGDAIRTRRNDRHLTCSDTDWVKNGDTWTITALGVDGALNARHHTHGLTVSLPAAYVREAVELGYATTIHGAQGSTVDTVHGLVTGRETRPDLYTLMTRGRHTNHVYLALDGTRGDTHDLVSPAATKCQTAREVLLTVAMRAGTATSASTELSRSQSPALLRETALARYADALTVACEDVLGPTMVVALEDTARELVPDVEDQPAWPTLRGSLLRAAADGHDPATILAAAVARSDARDESHPNDLVAALAWRITRLADLHVGRLPERVSDHAAWSGYLDHRARLAASHLQEDNIEQPTSQLGAPQPPFRHAEPSTPSSPIATRR